MIVDTGSRFSLPLGADERAHAVHSTDRALTSSGPRQDHVEGGDQVHVQVHVKDDADVDVNLNATMIVDTGSRFALRRDSPRKAEPDRLRLRLRPCDDVDEVLA